MDGRELYKKQFEYLLQHFLSRTENGEALNDGVETLADFELIHVDWNKVLANYCQHQVNLPFHQSHFLLLQDR